MKTIFDPAISLMNRLNYPQKFLVISFFFAVPLSLSLAFFTSATNEQINFTQKELDGTEYLLSLRQLMEQLIRSRLNTTRILRRSTIVDPAIQAQLLRNDQALQSLAEVEQRLGKTLNTETQFTQLKADLIELKQPFFSTETYDALYVEAINRVRGLTRQVGDSSNLILDPTLEAYYLMDTILLSLPQIQDVLTQIIIANEGFTSRGVALPEERERLISLSGILQVKMEDLNRGLTVSGANDITGKVGPTLDPAAQTLSTYITNVTTQLKRQNKQETLQPELSIRQAEATLNSSFEYWDQTVEELRRLLELRVNKAVNERTILFVSVAMLLLLVAYIFQGFYLAVMRIVSSLESASQKIVEGTLTEPLKLDNRDELVQSFNNIATAFLTVSSYRQAIVDNVAAGILTLSPQGQIDSFNHTAETIFNYGSAEMRGQSIQILIPDWQQIAAQHPNRTFRLETVGKRQNGSVFPVDLAVSRVDVNSQEVLVGILRDITERKQAEAKIQQSEAKYRDLVQAANSIILRWDAAGRITFLNEYGQQFFGYKESELIGKSLVGTLVPETESSGRNLQALIQDICLRPEAHVWNDNENLRRNGERVWVTWSNRPIFDDQNHLVEMLSVGVDATERKQIEVEMRHAKESAESANRAKSTFLANMSHELRTPLNAVLGFTQVMLREGKLNTDQQEYLEIINRSGEHLLSLINDVLEMSKIEAGRTTLNDSQFDLFTLLQTLEELFRLRAESKDLHLQFHRSPSVPQFIRADEGKLRQVLINLIGNAVKFTQKGSVSLTVDLDPKANVETTEPDPQVHPLIQLNFAVSDTGAGIAPEELDSLFQAFLQTESGRNSQEGTGLGLPISRQFVQLMGGDIEVKSEVGIGSTFSFRIPTQAVAPEVVPALRKVEPVLGLEPGQPTYRLLVVDDKWENRKLLMRLLTHVGFEAKEAANGQEAIELWESWDPHLIWMDMRMPVMDGYAATRHIKSYTKGHATVIIALTASALEEERAIILSNGCDDFLRKPFREEDLFAKIGEHLGVRFVYAHSDPEPAAPDQPDLTLSQLRSLPPEWVNELEHAALSLDLKGLNGVIERIRASTPALAQTLAELVSSYQFEQLQTLLEEGKTPA